MIRINEHKLLADLHTPVSIYLKVRDLFEQSALLESSDYQSAETAKSLIGIQPIARIYLQNNILTTQYPDQEPQQKTLAANTLPVELFAFLKSFDLNYDGAQTPSGFLGYSGYSAVQHFEQISIKAPHDAASDVPEMMYILYKYQLIINHYNNELLIVEHLLDGEESGIADLINILNNPCYPSYPFRLEGSEQGNTTDDQYRAMIEKGIAHCKRGDVFQIVLSRRFSQAFTGDDFAVYRSLRAINPSPYLFYFDFGNFRIFGSSPETHLLIKKNTARLDPIAGTFRRTGNDQQDAILAQQLLEDPKENAEHTMLVDLARNDLSKYALKVEVSNYKTIRYFSHVIHMLSEVKAELMPNTNYLDVFAACFPAGTLSGAPKVKAMQLIDTIEQNNRGCYGGCIGFLGFNAELNQAITIRSFVSKDNVLYYQAGAGVVAKSKVESEVQEVTNKLGALKKALSLAVNL